MNALKPTTPSSASSARRATLPGTSPPQSAKSTTAAPSAAAIFRLNASASTVGGCAFSGMSTTQVVPPAAADAVPVAQPSQSARPGSLKCTCGVDRAREDAQPGPVDRLGRRQLEPGAGRDDPPVVDGDVDGVSAADQEVDVRHPAILPQCSFR